MIFMENKFYVCDADKVGQASSLSGERVSASMKIIPAPTLLARAGWKPALR
jgi:hypothetical protein